ncbi:helix-turn-helix domain-containing protein [Celeribacter naphthalenivorans]|uniref:helix-turn-helix domain-containing protein n=1 Tax=Celeribacter naphthalenivorans TaxID=1614694 RepID=UPI001CF94924
MFHSDQSSISREIANARLNRIAADLASPQCAGRSVTNIAYARGITNFQSFSRSFKKHFGQTPSDYRANASTQR